MKLYTFTSTRGDFTYKFAIYAEDQVIACQYMQRMQQLFVDHHVKIYEAKINRYESARVSVQIFNQEIVAQGKKLSTESFTAENTECKWIEKEYWEHLGRQFGAPWCAFYILDAKTEALIYSFDLKSTDFDEYPTIAQVEIDKYQRLNDEEIEFVIQDYVEEFFARNPRGKTYHDLMKLRIDRPELEKKYDIYGLSQSDICTKLWDIYCIPYVFVKKQCEKIELAIAEHPVFSKLCYRAFKSLSSHGFIMESPNCLLDDISKFTPLMYSVNRELLVGRDIDIATNHSLQTSTLLLQAGANVNAQDVFGRTALMHIIVGKYFFDNHAQPAPGREKLVRLLLKYGADPTIKDTLGKTAVDYLREECEGERDFNHPAVRLLQESMRKFEQAKEVASNYEGTFFTQEPVKTIIEPSVMMLIKIRIV